MFSRKLTALSYPNGACFNALDKNDLRDLVVWLEDQKIRQYKPEDRVPLTNTPLPGWMDLYSGYLKDAECPFDDSDGLACVDWLLGYAIRLEYSDNEEKYALNSAEAIEGRSDPCSSLEEIDYSSPEFNECVSKLAKVLHIQPHPTDAKVTFRALSKYAQLYFNTPADAIADKEGTTIDLSKIKLAFDLNEETANQAARVLSLLFIQDLRDLQTRINEAIVEVQKLTADPKTDTRLGQVGR